MVPQPEQHARRNIDTLLAQAGWQVCDPEQVNLTAHRGVAIREFPLPGHGYADYLLYTDGKAAGVIEAKKECVTLTGVETQVEKYTQGLPTALPRWSSPLPFSYPSTGIETRFTNGLDPAPRSRPVFAFHKPETLTDFLEVGRIKERSDESANAVADATATYNAHGQTFLARLQHMPALIVAEIEKQFSRLDEAVANLKRVKANLKRYKAAVEGRLVETEAELARREGRSYETGAQLLQRILETRRSQWKGKGKYKEPAAPDTTDLPELPEGWVWASVEQMAEVGTGATPLRSKREYYDDGKIPWVTSGALNEEFISAADEYITDLAVQETNAKVFPAHTLLVAMYGEGKTRGKVSELLIDATTNQACAAIVMEGISAHVRDYAKLFFLKNYEDIRRLSSGGVQPNLNLSHIKATAIPLPPLVAQHRIVAEVDRRLSLVREVETQVDANLTRAERLRQSILGRAFSGKLVYQNSPSDSAHLAWPMAADDCGKYEQSAT